ncbi:MAG: DUF4157 domain-containing protein [Methylotenera sp.]|nr:DUF4157 domain-containing protein [Methylotenera sp.]
MPEKKFIFRKSSSKGRQLNADEHRYFQPYFQARTLHLVRVFEGQTPFWLAKKMCAVVLGQHIYFLEGAYQANTHRGIELLAHELTHVEQYLSGMTFFKYLWAARYGYNQNPYEVEAYAKGKFVREKLYAIHT